MTPEQALKLTGSFAHGASIRRRVHAAPVKSSYLIERRGERFVLRIDSPLALQLGLDRAAEVAVLNTAWRAGIGPQPIALIPGPPAILVTRFAPGEAWRPADLRDPARLERLAGILRRLHEARLPGPALDLGRACARYAARIGTPESRALAAGAAKLLRRCAGEPAQRCLCHNDPIPANVVGLRRTVLIDWEYAAIGDPLFDLAVVAQHHRLPRRDVAKLAAWYYGGAGRVPWERLEHYRAVYDIVLRLWSLCVGGA